MDPNFPKTDYSISMWVQQEFQCWMSRTALGSVELGTGRYLGAGRCSSITFRGTSSSCWKLNRNFPFPGNSGLPILMVHPLEWV